MNQQNKKIFSRSNQNNTSISQAGITEKISQANPDLKSQSKQKLYPKFKKSQQKNSIFYSQLHLLTHDKDVPEVRILKFNQQRERKFARFSLLVQRLGQLAKFRSMSRAFRHLANNMISRTKYQLKIKQTAQIINKLIKKNAQFGLTKLFAQKNKQKIKQKAFIVIKRLIISKINSNYRHFMKNCEQKKIMRLVLEKYKQDELINLKLNLEIFKQITFSKQFISKCRPLIRQNTGSKAMLYKQLIKLNFEEALSMELIRFQKIRQNFDSTNPNTIEISKKPPMRKKPVNNGPNYYENQIVLMTIKSFNLSLIETQTLFEDKISALHQQLSDLQSDQKYLDLQQQLNQSNSISKAYESLINQFYTRSDEEVKMLLSQYPPSKNQKLLKKKLFPVLSLQKSKYLKALQRLQKQSSLHSHQQYLMKMYKSRHFTLDLCSLFLNPQASNQYEPYYEAYLFVNTNLAEIVRCHQHQSQMQQLVQKLKQTMPEEDVASNSSMLLIQLSECFLALHKKYFIQKQNLYTQTSQSSLKKYGEKKTQQSSSIMQESNIQPDLKNKIIKKKNLKLDCQILSFKSEFYFQTIEPASLPLETQQLKPLQTNVVIKAIKKGILAYIKSINSQFCSYSCSISQNKFLQNSLLPENNGKNKLKENIKINQFLNQLNSELVLLASNIIKSSLGSTQFEQKQVKQLLEAANLFYELILSQRFSLSQQQKNSNQSKEMHRKWTQLCKKLKGSHKKSIISKFNEILILFRQINVSQQTTYRQNFSDELGKILKQKLQCESRFDQIEKKLLLRDEQYSIIEKMNNQYQRKHIESDNELYKLKNQSKFYTEKQEIYQQSIQRLKEQLSIYVNKAQDEAQQFNQLNREIHKLKNSLASLNDQVQQPKPKQTGKVISEIITTKVGYSFNEYNLMQNNYKLKLAQLQQHSAQSQHKKHQLENLFNQLKIQHKHLQRDLQECKFQNIRLNQERKISKREGRKYSEIKSLPKNQIDQLELYQKDQLIKSFAEIKPKQQKISKEKQQADAAQLEKLKLVQTQSLKHTIEHQQDQISNLFQQINSLNQQLFSRNTQIQSLKSQLHMKVSYLTANHDQQLNRQKQFYEIQIQQLQTKINNQQLAHQKHIMEFQLKLELLQHQKQMNSSNYQQFTQNHEVEKLITVLKYDPQKQIKSLKQFIQTLESENQKLQKKNQQLKKQLYMEDKSTVFSQKATSPKQECSLSYYQNIAHDLHLQNSRLYAEIQRLKSLQNSRTELSTVSSQLRDFSNITQQFWINQIKRKQSVIEQLQRKNNQLSYELKIHKQNEQKMQQKLNQSAHPKQIINQKQKYKQIEQELNHQIILSQNTQKRLHLQLASLATKLQQTEIQKNTIKQELLILKQTAQQFYRTNHNFEELLLSTKQVKQLFTSFIEATNAILYKLDRTSEIYLNFETNLINRRNSSIFYHEMRKSELLSHSQENSLLNKAMLKEVNSPLNKSLMQQNEMIRIQQEYEGKKAQQSIISLVQQFKTVIENNHETLKSIYENLVCHPYTKTALELQYLKQLTSNIISRFYIDSIVGIFKKDYADPTYSSLLAKQQLNQQINAIFVQQNSNRIKPIEQIFVMVEELIISKIQNYLEIYKKQLHYKALELDQIRQKLNFVVDYNLIQQNTLISKVPSQTVANFTYQEASSKHEFQEPLFVDNALLQQKYSNRNYGSKPLERTKKQQFKRPSSGNYIPQIPNDKQYRPLTSPSEKDDLMQKMSSDRFQMCQSQQNLYAEKQKHFSSF